MHIGKGGSQTYVIGKLGAQTSEEKKDPAEPAVVPPPVDRTTETNNTADRLLYDDIPQELQGRQFQNIEALHDELSS